MIAYEFCFSTPRIIMQRCCASMTNLQVRMACEAQHNALKGQAGVGPACTQLATQYRAAGFCTF